MNDHFVPIAWDTMDMTIAMEGASPLFTVYDVPTAVAFYRDLLGFKIVHTSQPFTTAKDDYGWAMLRHGDVQLMLNNAYEDNIRPPAPDPARIAAHADTILYIDCSDPDAAYKYLCSRGFAVQPPKNVYYGMRQLYFKDPDGYTLCLQRPIAA